MSYIFSRALVEEYLEASCSECEPFAPSNSSPIPQAYCSPGRMTAYSRLSRFGMTYAPLTDDDGAALLTWYLEASRARTFQPQEKAPALTAPAPASGGKCTELSMKYDRNSHSWKTHLCLWDEDLPESSVILPKSGTMRNGLCWERTTWGPRTSENASGYLHMIPTNGLQRPQQGEPFTGPQEPAGCSDNRLDAGDDVAARDNERSRQRVECPESLFEKRCMDRNSNRFREESEQEVSGGQQAAQSIRVRRDVPDSNLTGLEGQRFQPGQSEVPEFGNYSQQIYYPKNKRHVRGDREFSENERPGNQGNYHAGRAETNDCGEWWSAEPDVGRVAHGVAARVDRLKALGNGQVPAVAATAFRVLLERFTNYNPQLTLF